MKSHFIYLWWVLIAKYSKNIYSSRVFFSRIRSSAELCIHKVHLPFYNWYEVIVDLGVILWYDLFVENQNSCEKCGKNHSQLKEEKERLLREREDLLRRHRLVNHELNSCFKKICIQNIVENRWFSHFE